MAEDTIYRANIIDELMSALRDGHIVTMAEVSANGTVKVSFKTQVDEVVQEVPVAARVVAPQFTQEQAEAMERVLVDRLSTILIEEYERETDAPLRDRLFVRVKAITSQSATSVRDASRKADEFIDLCLPIIERRSQSRTDLQSIVTNISTRKIQSSSS